MVLKKGFLLFLTGLIRMYKYLPPDKLEGLSLVNG